MSNITNLVCGQLTRYTIGRKECKLEFSTNHVLKVPASDPIMNELAVGCYYFAAFSKHSNVVKHIYSCTKARTEHIDVAIKNLENATDSVVAYLSRVEKAERAVLLRMAGLSFTGFFACMQFIQGINAFFAWEPVNAVIGVGLAAVSAALTKMQWEDLTEQQKNAVHALKAFKRQLAVYQATVKRYKPEAIEGEVVIDDPRFTAIASKLMRIFPNVTGDSVRTDNVNYAAA